MGTLAIRGGEIIDGTGAPPFRGDVLIEGSTIRDVARPGQELPATDRSIDASGQVVCPGFIDMHSHLDFVLPTDGHPKNVRSFLEQGVTTVVAGNCGLSPAPLRPETRADLESFATIAIDEPLDWGWRSFADYLDRLETTGVAVNVAQLVGHSAVRYAATDVRRGPLSATDLDRCRGVLGEALDQGACGVSFGLGYDPGMFSPLGELEAFARVAAERDRPVTAHLKAYSTTSTTYPTIELRRHNVRALREMLELTDRAEARLQVSHVMFVGRRSWSSAGAILDLIDRERGRGRDVMIDAFPYTCGNSTVNALLPHWFLERGAEAFKSRAAVTRVKMELALGFWLLGFTWDDVQMMSVGQRDWDSLNGKSISEIAREWGMAPVEAFLTIADRTKGGALTLFHAISGDQHDRGPLEDVLTHEACLYETDAVVRDRSWPNPAAVGTFPKILRAYVREKQRLSLADAVHRMSGASAARFGLSDRGVIEVGRSADLVVFDPAVISDTRPTADRPPGRPVGIASVVMNGVEVVRAGSALDVPRAGRVLRG